MFPTNRLRLDHGVVCNFCRLWRKLATKCARARPCDTCMWGVLHPQAGKYERAIGLLVKHGWWERLLSLMRALDAAKDTQPLKAAVAAFKQAGTNTAQAFAAIHCVRTLQTILCAPHRPCLPNCPEAASRHLHTSNSAFCTAAVVVYHLCVCVCVLHVCVCVCVCQQASLPVRSSSLVEHTN